jgi:hypothetical protein
MRGLGAVARRIRGGKRKAKFEILQVFLRRNSEACASAPGDVHRISTMSLSALSDSLMVGVGVG